MQSIVVGKECNNKCLFCSIDANNNQTRAKSPEEIKTLIGLGSGKSIQFTGGEPTLREDLPELVSYAKNRFQRIDIDTNGRLLKNIKFLKKLVESGANAFEVSLLGTKPETHDFLSGVKGSFEETVQGVKNISELKKSKEIHLTIAFIVTKQNQTELKSLPDFLKKINPDFIRITHIKPSGRTIKNFPLLFPKYSESCPLIEQMDLKKSFDIFNIPACMISKTKRKFLLLTPTSTLVFSKEKKTIIFDSYARASVKKAECQDCSYFHKCPGVWKEYAEHYGLKEFNPIKK